MLPTSQSSWEHNFCSWMQFTIKCPQFEDKEEEVYENLCYVTFSSSPPEVQGLTTSLSCWALFLHVYILFYIVFRCLLHQFLELGMKICCLYFVCWKLRFLVFPIAYCKESLATASLLIFLLASIFVGHSSTKSLILCVPTLRGYGYVDNVWEAASIIVTKLF